MLDYTAIEINGLKVFEKAAMPNNSNYIGALENSACFMYMLQGSNNSLETNGVMQLQSTEGILKRCGNYISKFTTTGSSLCCEAVAIYFHPDFIKKIYHNEIPDFLYKSNINFNAKKVASNAFIQQYIQNLLPYFDNPEVMDEELATLKIKELILLLLKSEERTSVLDFFSELFASPTAIKLTDVVNNHMYTDITIEQMAFLCDMSLSTFKREFKKTYSDSPASYIRLQKIEKAEGLLLSTDMRIQEIGISCGFNELSSFSHTFQKVTGYSPTDYRLNQNNKPLTQ